MGCFCCHGDSCCLRPSDEGVSDPQVNADSGLPEPTANTRVRQLRAGQPGVQGQPGLLKAAS